MSPTKAFNDGAAAERLRELYDDAQNGMRRVIALGMYCFELQESNLKHGEFGPWVEKHCPQISYRSIRNYMQLTKGVLDACGVQIGSALPICHGGEILLLPDAQIPDESRKLRGQICELIDGKTQRQLLLEFKSDKTAKPERKTTHGPTDPVLKSKLDKETANNVATELWQLMARARAITSLHLCDEAILERVEAERVELGHFIAQIKRDKKKR